MTRVGRRNSPAHARRLARVLLLVAAVAGLDGGLARFTGSALGRQTSGGMGATDAAAQQQGSAPLGDEIPSPVSEAAAKLKALSDPDAVAKRAKERLRPPYEFIRTQIAPFEVLTFVKEHHWATLFAEVRSNDVEFEGWLQTAPVRLGGMPHAVTFRRSDRLDGRNARRMALSIFLPTTIRELPLELIRPEAIRPEQGSSAFLRKLEPHQMLIVVAGTRADDYVPWGRMLALIPTSGDPDVNALDRQRYYRLVASQAPEKDVPPFSSNPMTWSTISHVIWDDLDPDRLNDAQRRALLDWIHWGGQLVIMGGAGPSLGPLRDSFLGPYLPADPSGANALLTAEDLAGLSAAHTAPYRPVEGETFVNVARYLPATEENRLRPPPGKPIVLTGLAPVEGDPGVTEIPLGDPTGRLLLGVERRVGRGRILMLAARITEKAWLDWPGLDTLVRRVVLRRPEEALISGARYGILSGPDLTWVRYTARDQGVPDVSTGPSEFMPPRVPGMPPGNAGELVMPTRPVAAWVDQAAIPVAARIALQDASGLTIPGRDFVLTVILAYLAALVPVNWVVCRVLLRRRELAWVITPLLAFGFAGVVERGAARDQGFDLACDEIDVIELNGRYPRAHLSRFLGLAATGRVSFAASYPAATSPLALPLDQGNTVAGSDIAQSSWESYPEPTLGNVPIPPRSLTMIRAEQMIDLPGSITLDRADGPTSVTNRTGLDLRDAMVVRVGDGTTYRVGALRPDQTAALGPPGMLPEASAPDEEDEEEGASKAVAKEAEPADPSRWLDPSPLLAMLARHREGNAVDAGEWRLVAWTPGPDPEQAFAPAVDRHRGLRLVIAHLDYGPSPAFDLPDESAEILAPRPVAENGPP